MFEVICLSKFVELLNYKMDKNTKHVWIIFNISNERLPHLKHILCHLSPPATRSSAAYTDLPHLGHLGCSTGLKGILSVTGKKKKKEKIYKILKC